MKKLSHILCLILLGVSMSSFAFDAIHACSATNCAACDDMLDCEDVGCIPNNGVCKSPDTETENEEPTPGNENIDRGSENSGDVANEGKQKQKSTSDTADDVRQTTVEDVNIQRLRDFDGIIPSPGLRYRDRESDGGAPSRDLGKAIQNGDVHLDDIFVIVVKFIDLISKIAGSFAVIMFMWSGIQYMGSGLTDDKESAKNTLKWAIVGLVVTFCAWLLVTIIKTQLTGSM